ALRGIPAPESRWDGGAADLSILDALVYRSHLLGADRALANIGGGNTSSKETMLDHAGRETRVLWVKGSGTDLATITAQGFAGVANRPRSSRRERRTRFCRSPFPRSAAHCSPTRTASCSRSTAAARRSRSRRLPARPRSVFFSRTAPPP